MAPQSPRSDGAAAPGRLAAAGAGRFELTGELGFKDAARLLGEGDAAFGGLRNVELDLAGVSRADSAGLALLLEWSLEARASGREIRYRNIPSAIVSLAGIGDVEEMLAPVAGS